MHTHTGIVSGTEVILWLVLIGTGYHYKSQLLELERVSDGVKSQPLTGADSVVIPLKWQEWRRELENHPDKEWVEFLVRGIRQGFQIRHNKRSGSLDSSSKNMFNAREHEAVIQDYLEEELRTGRVWRVNPGDGRDRVQCSPFGVIPKKGRQGKWRLIVNLSAPEGRSVNEGIDKELCPVKYMFINNVVQRVLQLGVGAEIAKANISKHIGMYQSTCETGGSWVWNGKERCSWMVPCRSD